MQINVLKQKFPPKDKNNLWVDDNDVLRQFKDGQWVSCVESGSIDLTNYYTKTDVDAKFYQKENDLSLEEVIEDVISDLNISSSYDGGDVNF